MPMKDRLNELHQNMKLLETEAKPVMWTKRKKMDTGQTMHAYLQDANQIESELTKMKADVAELNKLQQDMVNCPFQDRARVTRYESLGERVRLDSTKIGASLKQLEQQYQLPHLSDDGVFKRVRTQQMNRLTAELNIISNDFFRIQAEYLDKMKSRLRRQLIAKGETVDESKLDSITDQNSYSVFTENYIIDVHNAEKTLRDLEDRQKDILALEKSISDVNQLFQEMNLLVTTQGETLDTIELAIEETDQCLQRGAEHLGEAVQSKRKFFRKKCCCIALGVTLGVVIFLIIVITLIQQNV
ncbi:syntaxin-11-like [Biomphalaria glabrata]|uniref:Syntaxin-11-like n=1 Tax=Biomphalaria glabrata TaxID=6526 RepID=A0A9U8E4K1_BIOGL|nr:syntaxin-11-like [Biomphalaria glabrata]